MKPLTQQQNVADTRIRGFYDYARAKAARSAPCVSRPDLVAERNGETAEPVITREYVRSLLDSHDARERTERAAVRHPVSGAWVIVTRGELGYRELGPRDHSAPFDGNAFNAEHGITAERADAMLAGSMFGWDCPAAQRR